MFYFTRNYLLSSTWALHAETLAKIFATFLRIFTVKNILKTCLEVVTCEIKYLNIFGNVLFYT